MNKKKKNEILDKVFDHNPPEVDEEALEKEIESGEIQPLNTYSNLSDSDAVKVALCQTIIEFKNRKKLSQKELADLLESDKSTISLICHYSIKGRLSEHRLFKLVQRLIRYENSYRSIDRFARFWKKATSL